LLIYIYLNITYYLLLNLIYNSDNNCVNGAALVAKRHSRTASGRNKHLFADTRAYRAVNSNDVLVSKLCVLDKLYLKELEANELVELIRRYDISYYFSS